MDSNNPGPSSRCTSMAQPIILLDSLSNFIFFVFHAFSVTSFFIVKPKA